jgi:Na+-transporting methylmalonyl-CoA/oxaloacetate decarboxylase gamma subunit
LIIAEAQQDNRRAFVGGGPGAFISGVLWLASAAVLTQRGVGSAFAFLFFGGMLIFPLSSLVSRHLFKRPKASKSNQLGRVALESTIAMIGGLFAAWLFLPIKPAYVFPLAAVAIGTHYAAFRTVYGNTLFWVLAGLITAVGLFDILGYIRFPGGPALGVGVLEIVFGILLTVRDKGAKTP